MARAVVKGHIVVTRIDADVGEGVEPPADAASVGDVRRIDLNVVGGVGEAEHVGVSGPLELRRHEALLVQLLVSGTKCKVQSARSESRMNMRTRWLD